ncbi:MAG: DUF4418 family protein [Chloroflexi bacterium]|nr:DUF4418 family protein [Chloroflexota bacterium]MBU1750560.1 DUF4418 family protein [Chloroflexota bacterium]MBU1878071.1 DUF4418 family protein [Chloroflexota bacterium]
MRIIAVLIVVLAILIGVIPQFTDCQSQGRALTLANGKEVAMKCHWTGQGELALSLPLLVVGALLFFSRRKESRLMLGVLMTLLGLLVILLPTGLIGVCSNPDMICLSVMQPALILMGVVVAALGVLVLVFGFRSREEVA